MKKKLALLDAAAFGRQGERAAARLCADPLWRDHAVILAFLSMDGEIDTEPLFRRAEADGKSVFVPRIEGELSFYRYIRPGGPRAELHAGGFGIREPEPKTALAPEDFPALVIVPGLAFDLRGRRLGRGRGFYDRFFAALDSAPASGPARSYTALGLCMEEQLVPEVPAEDHDKTMDLVLAGKRLIKIP